jgi:hypothetical protein
MNNNPFRFFDAIYVINMDFCLDRWMKFLQLAKKYDIPNPIRFPAFRHEVGSFGCAHSHRLILKEARRRKLSNVLIFEDDVDFIYSPDFTLTCLSGAIKRLGRAEWDLFYLGINPKNSRQKFFPDLFEKTPGTLFVPRDEFYGRFAYAVNSQSFNVYDNITNEIERFSPADRGDIVLMNSKKMKHMIWPCLTVVSDAASFTGFQNEKLKSGLNKKSREKILLKYRSNGLQYTERLK